MDAEKSGWIYIGREAICVCGKLKNRNDDKNVMKRKWWTLLHAVLFYSMLCVCVAQSSHVTQCESTRNTQFEPAQVRFYVRSLEHSIANNGTRFVDLIDRQIIVYSFPCIWQCVEEILRKCILCSDSTFFVCIVPSSKDNAAVFGEDSVSKCALVRSSDTHTRAQA